MSNKHLRILAILGFVALSGIILVQIYWIKNAYHLEVAKQDQAINSALMETAREMMGKKYSDSRLVQPVTHIRPEFWVVRTDNPLDANLLEHTLRETLTDRNIKNDFEYSIYDCNSQKLVYGDYVKLTGNVEPEKSEIVRWPNWDKESYYFGIYFPDKNVFAINGMQAWAFSSFAILFIILFYVFSLYVILRQKRLSELQKDFINTMTHEFKTPLATISLSAQALANTQISGNADKRDRYSQIIINEATRIKGLIEQVLQVAQVEKKRYNLNKSNFEVDQIFSEVKNNFQPYLQKNSQSIEIESSHGLMLTADRQHFTQIIINLLDNAIKYSGRGSVIKIEAYKKGNNSFISIVDNGAGMSKEVMENLFKKFTRGHHGKEINGFGLGLYYVYHVIKAHGGTIQAFSEEGKGARFNITLPN